jgi:hypothetical protein
MEQLIKSLVALIKALKTNKPIQNTSSFSIPPLKPIRPPSVAVSAKAPPKPIAPAPNSKKDPKKIAQQIKDGSMSTKTQKLIKVDKNGQWSLDPTSEV